MGARFTQIFWGLVLGMLDFGFDGIDLLPDFVGYGLIAVGAAGLASESRCFLWSRNLALPLVALSLLDLALWGDTSVVLASFGFLIEALLLWFLLSGIVDAARARGLHGLAQSAADRRTAYAVLVLLLLGLGLAAREVQLPSWIALVVAAGFFVLLVLVLLLIQRARGELTAFEAREQTSRTSG